MIYTNRVEKVYYELVDAIRRLTRTARLNKAKRYLQSEGVLALFSQGEESEYGPKLDDLYILHREVRQRRPKTILEFGVGFSTLVMAHALKQNHDDALKKNPRKCQPGKIFAVDSLPKWIDNCREKFPPALTSYTDLRFSVPEIATHNGELCHFFRELPDVCPDLIYLDGPDPQSVQGDFRNLSFAMKDMNHKDRYVMSADILLYEGTLKPGARIIVDGRKNNTRFLRRHLKRNWKFFPNKSDLRFIFELLD